MDDYANRFIEFRMKVNWNNTTPVEQVVFKFVQGLKSQVISLVYVGNPQTLDEAITTTRNIEGGLVIANESKQVYTLED